MKVYLMVAIVALSATAAGAKHRDDSQSGGAERQVTASVHYYVQIPPAAISYAQALASKMFRSAGVELCWRTDNVLPDDTDRPISIDLTSNTPPSFHPGATAFASPFEGTHIRLFYDRIDSAVTAQAIPTLLAHVLVHEITHILQGTNIHSEEGVMKARWTGKDLRQMMCAPLPFTLVDAQLIDSGLAKRNRVRQTQLLSSR